MFDGAGEQVAEQVRGGSSRRTRSERTKRRERYQRKAQALTSQVQVQVPLVEEEDSLVGVEQEGAWWCRQLPANGNRHSYQRGKRNGYGNNNDSCRKCGQRMEANGDSVGMSKQNRPEAKPKDHLYKILVIGDLGAGKTSIIKRYVHQFFTQHYRATIGVDFALKVINWDATTLIRLQLWDIAGQERFGNMTRVYYKEAVGTFIVFDVTRANTFESVANWKADLDSKVQLADGSPIPCVLLANKCDQPKEGIVESPAKMDKFCKEKGFVAWFETSAKENINIEEAAKALVLQILQNDIVNNKDGDREQFSLASKTDEQSPSGKSCSC